MNEEIREPQLRGDESLLMQDGYSRDGFYRFVCYQCQARIELPFTFFWMLTYVESRGVFALPEKCPVKFCWGCGRKFIRGKILGENP